MVINSDSDDSSTTKRNDFVKPRYRPQFLDHFERKNPETRIAADQSPGGAPLTDKISSYSPAAAHAAHAALAAANTHALPQTQLQNHNHATPPNANTNNSPALNASSSTTTPNTNDNNWENNMEMHFQQISGMNQYALQQHQQHLQQQQQIQQQQALAAAYAYMQPPPAYAQQQQQQHPVPAHAPHHLHSQSHSYVDGEFEFLKFLTFDDLHQRLNNIDSEMEKEIEELNKKYNAKRQPIVDAMNAKRKRQQNINNNLIKI